MTKLIAIIGGLIFAVLACLVSWFLGTRDVSTQPIAHTRYVSVKEYVFELSNIDDNNRLHIYIKNTDGKNFKVEKFYDFGKDNNLQDASISGEKTNNQFITIGMDAQIRLIDSDGKCLEPWDGIKNFFNIY